MIDGYMKNGKVDDAVKLFEQMPQRDAVSWIVLIGGFVKKGQFEQALEWFREMQLSGVEPDYVTLIVVIAACADLGTLWIRLVDKSHSYFIAENWVDYPLLQRFVHQYQIDESHFSTTAFIKFVINRSKGHATALRLPPYASETDLKYVSDVCGDLKDVGLPEHFVCDKSGVITELIGKWKRLEWLTLGSSYALVKILSQISIHCKDFWGLRVSNADIVKDKAIAIVNFLPKIKHLILRDAHIHRDALMKLLQGCTELQVLDVSDCIGFSEDDGEILKLASHITNFSCKGSSEYDDDFYEEGPIFAHDYGFYYSD
ncbi:putative F-box/LRR-repeat protein 23 [Prunus avium]|uniref:F-box/LRR-repeat protein 23 n=1 Tax=Prunus avium TaxID=42229 RepID=A0A6P5T7Q4_PRUAV|nr:putative F-box/LRR-repeat protein 23 [Prunus avium]